MGFRTVRRLRVDGPATPAVAWERYADLSRWSDWAPQIRSVEASGPRLRQGLSGQVDILGVIAVPFTVLSVDPSAYTWGWLAHLGPMVLELHHSLEPRGTGSSAALFIDGPGPVVTAYAPLAAWALRRLVA